MMLGCIITLASADPVGRVIWAPQHNLFSIYFLPIFLLYFEPEVPFSILRLIQLPREFEVAQGDTSVCSTIRVSVY